MNIEIGGGSLVGPGWINMDPTHFGTEGWRRNAQDGPWPAGDGSVTAIRASHVMEHIPAGVDRLFVMNEAHRVLAPGGTFEIIVPLMTGSWHAVADPTHVSFWCLESFHYFDGLFAANADYGIRPWTTKELHVLDDPNIGRWVGTPR